MARILDELKLVDEASSVAAESADRAGVRITELTSLEELTAAADLYDAIWTDDLMPLGLLRALSFSRNYVAGAFSDDKLVGAVTGFRSGDGDDHPHLHSHILGVLPDRRSRNVGYALKLHQRAWALDHQLATVIWTFDPLISRNAYFNLVKLGADAGSYLVNFYGEMNDAQNVGEESDRLVVLWNLDSDKAVAAARGEWTESDIDSLKSGGASVVLDDDHGKPVVKESSASASTLLLRLPSDIVEVRLKDPRLGRSWRLALRDTLGTLLAGNNSNGYRVAGITRSGWYVLRERSEGQSAR